MSSRGGGTSGQVLGDPGRGLAWEGAGKARGRETGRVLSPSFHLRLSLLLAEAFPAWLRLHCPHRLPWEVLTLGP